MDASLPASVDASRLGRTGAETIGKMKNASPAFAGEAFSVVWGDIVSGGKQFLEVKRVKTKKC